MENNKQFYYMYPTEIQKEKIENTFNCYMDIYNSLIQYSRNIGKDKALTYNTDPKLYREVNQLKLKNKKLSIIDNSTLVNLINTYKNDLNKTITKNKRFPLKKTTTSTYVLDNSINKTSVDFYNIDYIKLPKLGYVKLNRNIDIPIESNINKAIIYRDESSNYKISLEYDDTKLDNNRKNRRDIFFNCYNKGIFPDGNKIPDYDLSIKKKIRLSSDFQINTKRNVINNEKHVKNKKEIVSINYVNRDYIKKLDEYEHALKLYKKYPQKFSKGVIFGHTIILPKKDGIDFDVIYDSDPLSSYRHWNIKMSEKEKEIIRRQCQDRVFRNFKEVYEEKDIENIDQLIENLKSIIEQEQYNDYIKEDLKRNNILNEPEITYEYDISENVEDFEVKDLDELDNQTYTPTLTEDDELAELLLQSNIIPQQKNNYQYTPSYQISGNNNWNYTNSYYNTSY